MKAIVLSPDGDSGFFNIIAGVLQRDMLALFIFIICQDDVFQTPRDQIKIVSG